MKKFKFKKILLVIFLIILISLSMIGTSPITVMSHSTTSVNAELSSLRSRVNRLESEIRRLNRANNLPSPRTANTPRNNSSDVNGNTIESSDPLFKRFATLLVELKEDVKDLNQRLTAIEDQLN